MQRARLSPPGALKARNPRPPGAPAPSDETRSEETTMKRRRLVVAMILALSGCAYDPYGPDVAGSVAVGPSGVYAGSVIVGTGG